MIQGARMAQPGEFTRRAFLNGRIDLTQAEAVIDMISAKTLAGLKMANRQLGGMLYREATSLKEKLVNHLALVEAHIDFAEEGIEGLSASDCMESLRGIAERVEKWIASYEEGKIFRNGAACAIVGKTNVGKSSLLNVLLSEDRAIVTSIPGTTRDVIEEVLNIGGIPVRLIDTAGLRKTEDRIEKEGVRKTREMVSGADIILLVIDRSRDLDDDDREIMKEIDGKKRVVVLNKKDLPRRIEIEELRSIFRNATVVDVSALKEEGIEELKATIYNALTQQSRGDSQISDLIVTNVRHKNVLVEATESLANAIEALEGGNSLEFVAFEIRSALESLGEIVGETTNEEVLNRIFEQFCVGK